VKRGEKKREQIRNEREEWRVTKSNPFSETSSSSYLGFRTVGKVWKPSDLEGILLTKQ
jgi:hypothetical protein